MNPKTRITILGTVIVVALTATVSVADEPPDGNRYYSLPRLYKSEISVSEAYLAMEHSKDYKKAHGEPKPVLIDVRSLREYASGHPEDAYNVPYPTVRGESPELPKQLEAKLYWEVYDIVRGDVDTPIMTLCRTGSRSIAAGNILADPTSYGISGPRFTNVRNIWEGFVGQPKYAFDTGTAQIHLFSELDEDGNAIKYELNDGNLVYAGTDDPVMSDFDGPLQLDLNNDGVINSDAADVYTQTKDANPDKDGWRNFANLPWTTHIQKPLAYERDPKLYRALTLSPVQ